MTYDDTDAEDLNKKENISYAKFRVIFNLVPLVWNAKYILLTKTSVTVASSKHIPREERLQPLLLFSCSCFCIRKSNTVGLQELFDITSSNLLSHHLKKMTF